MIANDFPSYLLDINDFQPLEFLGENRQGKLIMMKHIKTGRIVYARFINDGFLDINEQQLFLSEIWVQMRLQHPCIQKFRGYTLLRDDYDGTAALIYDFVSKNTLADQIIKASEDNSQLTPTVKSKILFGIGYAFQYIHSLHLLYRNLKTSKVLLNDQLMPIISDFSQAIMIPDGDGEDENGENQTLPEIEVVDAMGTPQWKSPEMRGRNHDDNKFHLTLRSDVFQFGLILYNLMTYKLPKNDELDNWNAYMNDYTTDLNENEDLVYLFTWLTAPNPIERPSFSEFIELYKDDSSIPHFDGTDINELKQFILSLDKNFYSE